jgi:hypothetical protein
MTRTRTATTPKIRPVGPTITAEITGGKYLTEMNLTLKAITRFDPTRQGRRCLRGSRGYVPPMNTEVRVVLPHTVKAVYLFGKSSHAPAEDVHCVLVPSVGSEHILPLTLASPEKDADVARLTRLLEAAKFQTAFTMPLNPHGYTRRETWASDEEFEWAIRAIRRYGRKQGYVPPDSDDGKVVYSETIFEYGTHYVWTGWQPPPITGWINRKVVETPVEPRVVSQTLTIRDATPMIIKPLPLDFGGLDPTVTQCPFFRCGVELFGWPVPEKQPRRRKAVRA